MDRNAATRYRQHAPNVDHTSSVGFGDAVTDAKFAAQNKVRTYIEKLEENLGLLPTKKTQSLKK